MSIEADITIMIAEVEVTDDYRVMVSLHERVTTFSLSEAEQLANELVEAVVAAQAALREDFYQPEGPVHGFDVAPSCRECIEGKHGACDGTSIVIQDGDEVLLTDCGCAIAGHNVAAPPLSPVERATVARFGLDKPEVS